MISGPDPREVHIWFRDTVPATPEMVEAARATLSAEERVRADRFIFAKDRHEYTLAHDLLRRCLSMYRHVEPSAWEFETAPDGKPFLPGDRSLAFNLSHTRGLVACAIGTGMPVGVDAEGATRVSDAGAIAERYFSLSEVASLGRRRDAAHKLRFLELWTLKEAFIKAVGVGLSQPLDSMSFALDDEGAIAFEPPPGFAASEWHFAMFEVAGSLRIAVAAQAATPPRFIARASGPGGPAFDVSAVPASRVMIGD
jgi:4'-phosphopantetheinyl transferase